MIDDALGDEVRVTVIAAGFDGGQPPRRNRPEIRQRQESVAPMGRPSPMAPAEVPATPIVRPAVVTPVSDPDDDLDVPDFLK